MQWAPGSWTTWPLAALPSSFLLNVLFYSFLSVPFQSCLSLPLSSCSLCSSCALHGTASPSGRFSAGLVGFQDRGHDCWLGHHVLMAARQALIFRTEVSGK